MSLFDDVRAVIVEQLDVKPDEVTPEASFKDDLGADSLDAVEFIMVLEEKFSIEIPDEDAEMMQTVDDVIKYIENKVTNLQDSGKNEAGY